MIKKPSESCRKYTLKWRQTASQVTEKETVIIFMRTLSTTYYDSLIGYVGAQFANLVQIGEHIEDGLKIVKIKDYQKLCEQSSNSMG